MEPVCNITRHCTLASELIFISESVGVETDVIATFPTACPPTTSAVAEPTAEEELCESCAISNETLSLLVSAI